MGFPTVALDKAKLSKLLVAMFLALLLLWLSFRNANLKEVWKYMCQADILYLFLMCFSSLFSHVIRAKRWLILLAPISPHKINLWNAFSAVIYGYAVNVVLPRGGEIARLVSISKSENLPWAGVLPTLLIDRLLDIAVLVLLLGGSLIVLPPSLKSAMPWLIPTGEVLTVITVLSVVALPKLGFFLTWLLSQELIKKFCPSSLSNKLRELSVQFEAGTKSLTNGRSYPAIGSLTFAIWFLYWLNVYLMLKAFHLTELVNIKNSLIVFTISAISVLAPTPGAIGSYHFFVSQALSITSGIDQNKALAFATVLHALALVGVNCIAALFCLIIQAGREKEIIKPSN